MTDHATEAAQDQHSRDLATIASLRAQLAAANDVIARVRALCERMAALHSLRDWTDELDAALSETEPTR
jgi:N-methylhydantoinase B/oxoprolinase/acetone carboxylase alpha subunit